MFERILYAAKEREWAETATAYVRDLALAHGSEVIVLRVTEEPADQTLIAEKLEPDARTAIEGQRRSSDVADYHTAESITEGLIEDGVRARTLIRRGRVADEILAAAEQEDADLVAIGSVRRSAVTALLTASVPSEIVRKAVRPVLIVPAPA